MNDVDVKYCMGLGYKERIICPRCNGDRDDCQVCDGGRYIYLKNVAGRNGDYIYPLPPWTIYRLRNLFLK